MRELTLIRPQAVSLMGLDRRISNLGIFFGATLMLVIYLLAEGQMLYFPPPLFFLAIALMALSLVYQVFFADLSRGFAAVVILEIAVASLVFHLIYQLPTYGLYGTDAYYDLGSLKAILESGHVGGVRELVQITSFFPVIHVLGAEFSLLTGVDYFATAKWFPAIIGTISVPMIYLLVRHLFKRERAALLSALLYASVQHYIMFGSLFVRETIAIVLAISCIYFYTAARSSAHPVAYRGLAIVFLAGTILAHHLTTVMLLLLLAFYWGFTTFARSPESDALSLGGLEGDRVTLSFLLLGIVGTLTYWLSTVVEPVQIGKFFLENVFTPSVWGLRTILQQDTAGLVSLPNLRYFFLIYGSYLSYAIFGLILLYRTFSRRGTRFYETPAFTAYLLVCGIIGFMSFYLLPPTVGGDRFLAFGWLFAFGPLALAIIDFRNRLMATGSFAVVVFFIFVNLFTVHPTLWDRQAGEAGGAAWRQDFALAQKVDFSRGDILGYMSDLMTIYEAQNNLGTDVHFLLDPIDFTQYRWLVINRAGLIEQGLYSEYTLEALDRMTELDGAASPEYSRVYESNNVAVLERR